MSDTDGAWNDEGRPPAVEIDKRSGDDAGERGAQRTENAVEAKNLSAPRTRHCAPATEYPPGDK